MVNLNLKETNGLVMAYLGDVVWELNVREHWISKGYNIRNINTFTKKCVNAKIQSEVLKALTEELNSEEIDTVRKGKNSNIKSFPKSCSINEYREATAFEALIAYWYCNGNEDKIKRAILKVEELI